MAPPVLDACCHHSSMLAGASCAAGGAVKHCQTQLQQDPRIVVGIAQSAHHPQHPLLHHLFLRQPASHPVITTTSPLMHHRSNTNTPTHQHTPTYRGTSRAQAKTCPLQWFVSPTSFTHTQGDTWATQNTHTPSHSLIPLVSWRSQNLLALDFHVHVG